MSNITIKRKEQYPLAVLAIILLCAVISISIGFFVAFDNANDEILSSLKSTGGAVQVWLANLFSTIKSDELLKKIPAIQSVVTIAGILSIFVTIKQLKKKD